jgi:lipopolysaccharide transport system permease protein
MGNKSPIVIERGNKDIMYWREIWNYRELFFILAWRDISVRYKQTVIGMSWAVIKPILTMIIFTIIFDRVAKLNSDGNTPYVLLVFAGMLPWFLFSNILNESSNSLISNSNLIGKVYFPRIIVPLSSGAVSFIDFLINFIVMIILMALYWSWPDWRLLLLPLFVILTLAAALGPALLFSALNLKYRDFRYIIPFIVQFGLYVSPVGFSSANLPEEWRLLYGLNPMVGVIDGFRWCLLGGQSQLHLPSLIVSIAVIFFLVWYGLLVFRRTEKAFADLI